MDVFISSLLQQESDRLTLDLSRKAMGKRHESIIKCRSQKSRTHAKPASDQTIKASQCGLDKEVSLESIEKTLARFPVEARERFMLLKLAHCEIMDEDLDQVLHIVQMLPKCRIVDLSGAALRTSTADDIRAFFDGAPHVEYLCFPLTDLAGFRGRTMFDGLDEASIRKIIFMHPDEVLSDPSWKATIRNTALHEAVVQTHTTFFAQSLARAHTSWHSLGHETMPGKAVHE